MIVSALSMQPSSRAAEQPEQGRTGLRDAARAFQAIVDGSQSVDRLFEGMRQTGDLTRQFSVLNILQHFDDRLCGSVDQSRNSNLRARSQVEVIKN